MLWQCQSEGFVTWTQVCLPAALYCLHMTWQSSEYVAIPDEAYDSNGSLDTSCKTGVMASEYEGWFECLDGTHRTEACEYPFHSCTLPQLHSSTVSQHHPVAFARIVSTRCWALPGCKTLYCVVCLFVLSQFVLQSLS